MTPCSFVTSLPTFRRNICLHLHSRRVNQGSNQFAMFAACFLLVSCLSCSSSLRMEATGSSETPLNLRLTARQYVRAPAAIACTSPCFIRLRGLRTRLMQPRTYMNCRWDGNLRKIRLENQKARSLCPRGVGFESRPRHRCAVRSS
jgi:hypothetical protein